MKKSLKKLYELDRTYDFDDFNTPAGRRIAKRRAKRRVRQMFNQALKMQA